MIALNKPYGIQKTDLNITVTGSINTGSRDFYNLSLMEALPHLRKMYDCELKIVGGSERYENHNSYLL